MGLPHSLPRGTNERREEQGPQKTLEAASSSASMSAAEVMEASQPAVRYACGSQLKFLARLDAPVYREHCIEVYTTLKHSP